MTQNNNQLATFNTSMLDRSAGFEKKESVMDSFHKIKMYNANTFSKDPKDHTLDPELVGKLRVVEGGTGEIKYIDSGIKVDILSVCKVKSGNIFLLDEFGDPITKDDGTKMKAFFMTNEHSIYTKKTDIIGFKQLGSPTPLGFYTKSELEEMLKTKRIGNKYNPFYEQGKKKDGEPYNTTKITDTFIIYGKFLEGPYANEYFKFVPVGAGWGTTYKDGKQIEPLEGTFLKALQDGLEELNKVRKSSGKSALTTIDPSMIDVVIGFKEKEIEGKKMISPTFKFDMLTGYRADNSAYLNEVLDLQAKYLQEEFGVTVIANNFRLGSIKDVVLNSPNELTEVKLIESKAKEAEVIEAELIEDEVVAQITPENAKDIFDGNGKKAASIPF